MGIVCGRSMQKIKELSMEHDCHIIVPPRSEDPDSTTLLTLKGSPAAVQYCCASIQRITDRFLAREHKLKRHTSNDSTAKMPTSMEVLPPLLPTQKNLVHHIFIDYSNAMAGAKTIHMDLIDSNHRAAIATHMQCDKMLDLVCNGRVLGQLEIIGALIPHFVQTEARLDNNEYLSLK